MPGAENATGMTAYLSIDALTVAYGTTRVLDRVSLDVDARRDDRAARQLGLRQDDAAARDRRLRDRRNPVRSASTDATSRALPPERRGTAMMFQSYALWPHMTVAANIGYGLRMRGWKKDAIAARVDEMLALLQLEGFGRGPVTQLSGGQRQRVALGRALAVNPSLLLLDEPMSNLDYKVRLELRHELRALQQRIGITAVYVTHDREEALTLADRIAVIDAGRIVQYGAPEDVFHRPTSAFVAGFMGADNGLDLFERADGTLVAAGANGAGRAVRAHFRGDAARLVACRGTRSADTLMLPGVVAQAFYIGQGYRYRVRAGGTEVWVHAPERMAEGTAASVAVPRAALMLFPRDSTTRN